MSIGNWRQMPRGGRRRQQARRPPHIWDRITLDQLEQMQNNNAELAAHTDAARNSLDFTGRVRLTVMEAMEKERNKSGQSAKVKE